MTEQSGTSIPSPAEDRSGPCGQSVARQSPATSRDPLPGELGTAGSVRLRGEALAFLRGQSVPVLLCERDHADGSWEDLLSTTARLPAPPNIIVFSRLADESLWAEVMNMGGFDVLITPFEPQEVLRVTFAAWSRWQCDFCAAPSKKGDTDGLRN